MAGNWTDKEVGKIAALMPHTPIDTAEARAGIAYLLQQAYARGRADAEADTVARIAEARREERERCARVAEGQETIWKHWFGDEDNGVHAEGRSFASYWIARRIRALPDPAGDAPAGTGRPELDKLVADALAAVERMTPEQREAMWEAQRQSWARGEMAMGESVQPDALSEARRRLLSDEARAALKTKLRLEDCFARCGIEEDEAVDILARAAIEAAIKVMEGRDQ